MISKKDIPLELLKAIEMIAQANLDIIHLSKEEENTYYFFLENDSNSKNFFKIFIDGKKRIGNYDRKNFAYEWKPSDALKTTPQLIQSSLQDLIVQFESWLKIIREIYNTPSVHDDNFVKSYSDFYFNEYKIVDADANTAPFNPEQQDLIDEYLVILTKKIEENNKEINLVEKNELLLEIQEIKAALPISTKNQVMKSITKVFGKLYKLRKSLAKEVVKEFGKLIIKKLFELGVEYGPKVIEMFSNHHGN